MDGIFHGETSACYSILDFMMKHVDATCRRRVDFTEKNLDAKWIYSRLHGENSGC